ncbi:MAG TPA: ABC-F family ATP-binding cassette domain-containing protein [Candidatus Blautia pullistercoris]|uniref:ABC-F family ATP-binding cassette domain-containing protein n=1 Tax=Candidatus Blautia pullistercoris TaxID=2838499 RepID=A0A9D2ANE2_9FIRM|nr:ABC-F family ATP-binding cassette domain-containing protein [Candidatus Blautia pullistercoris]
MNIINIEHIDKIFGDKVIFHDASLGIQQGDKIGIIGINGTGKSTLLKIIAGEEEPDTGEVIYQNGLKILYLPQNPEFPREGTLASYALKGDPQTDWQVESYLNILGITDLAVPFDTLSGGQKRKAAMARALSQDFDVLLLDEPTNHLDMEMIGWLEEYLRNMRKTLLMVTHDRYFLDRTVNKILEISRGSLYEYETDYSGFLERKAQREEMELASERKRQSILRIETQWAQRGCRARSTKQRARLERLEALKNGKVPVRDQNIELESQTVRMGKKTIELSHISKSYGDKVLIRDFSYIFLKNQKVGFIGKNGCGKSTLMKIIAGLVSPDSGTVDRGETVRIGYFAQEEPEMDPSQRVIDYVKDMGEYFRTGEGRISASQMLERFLFTPDMQYSPIGKLSGGERRRLYLLGVLAGEINVLIMDEAGNNLDIPTMTILEEYLLSFQGIVITVSHDRYFLDNVADRIFEFDGQGGLRQYEGGYTDYLEAKKNRQDEIKETEQPQTKKEGNRDWKGPRQAKVKFSFKEQREYETIDQDISDLEERISKLEEEILANATNSAKLNALMAEKEEAEAALEKKMDRWVYLTELAERIEAEKNK